MAISAQVWRTQVATALMILGPGLLIGGLFLKPPWLYVGFAWVALGVIVSKQYVQIPRMPGFFAGIALAFWAILSILIAHFRGQPGVELRLPVIAYSWILTPLVAIALIDPIRRIWALRMMCACAAIAACVGLLQTCVGFDSNAFLGINLQGERFARAKGLGSLHLSFGYAGALVLVLSAQPSQILPIPPAMSWVLRLSAVIVVTISGSRAAMVGAIAGLFATLLRPQRRWILMSVGITLVFSAVIVGRFLLFQPGQLERIQRADDGRFAIWQASQHIIQDNPVFGVGGRKAYKAVYNDVYQKTLPTTPNEFGTSGGAPHAHNTQIALAAEYGLPMPGLHLLFYGAILLFCWRHRKSAPTGWHLSLGIVTTTLVAGLFEPYPTQAVPGLGTAAMLGLAVAFTLEKMQTSHQTLER